MKCGRLEVCRPAAGSAALTAVGPLALALAGTLISSTSPAPGARVPPAAGLAYTLIASPVTAAPTASPAASPAASSSAKAAPAASGKAAPATTATPATAASPTASPTATPAPATTSSPTGQSGAARSDSGYGPVTPTCEVRSIYKIKTNRSRNFWIPGTHFVDGPGGKIKVWIEREHIVETSLLLEKEARLEFDFKTFIAEVRKMVSPIVTTQIRVELGHEYLRSVSKGRYGHMRYRVFGYRIGFRQWRQYGNCSIRFVGSGLATLPTSKQGWKYWETESP